MKSKFLNKNFRASQEDERKIEGLMKKYGYYEFSPFIRFALAQLDENGMRHK